MSVAESTPGTNDSIRISVEEIQQRMDAGEEFFLIDTRTPAQLEEADSTIPGALNVFSGEVDNHSDEIPHDRVILTYCT